MSDRVFKSLADVTALVVDDDSFSLAVTPAALSAAGVWEVLSCRSARDAQFVVESIERVTLIVYDLSLSGVDGVKFLRWLADRQCQTPIIVTIGVDERLLHSAEYLVMDYKLHILGSFSKSPKKDDFEKLLWQEKTHARYFYPDKINDDTQHLDLPGAIDSGFIFHYQSKLREQVPKMTHVLLDDYVQG